MARLEPRHSPCRSRSTGSRRHVCSPAHADLIYAYRCAVADWEQRAELVTRGYETEMREYVAANPRPTLKMFMVARREA